MALWLWLTKRVKLAELVRAELARAELALVQLVVAVIAEPCFVTP